MCYVGFMVYQAFSHFTNCINCTTINSYMNHSSYAYARYMNHCSYAYARYTKLTSYIYCYYNFIVHSNYTPDIVQYILL